MKAWLRILVGVIALALLGGAVEMQRRRQHERMGLEELLAATGIERRQPEVAQAARSDPDAVRARLTIARALLAESYDQRPFSRLPLREAAEEAARVGERLDLARDLARRALAERPAAWQAAMVLGGATYRLLSMRGEPGLATQRDSWEAPLRAASRLAPGEPEPLRLLAVAYLELWPQLDEESRRGARAVVRQAFRDPQTFALAADLWLALATDQEDAFAAVPDAPEAWGRVAARYAGSADWTSFLAATARRERSMAELAEQRLAEAEARVEGGDIAGARTLLLGLIAALPPDGRWAPAVERAVRLLPAGAPRAAYSPHLAGWTDWAIDGFVHRTHGLDEEVLLRLAAGSDPLPPETEAMVYLAVGRLADAEAIERRSAVLNGERWAPYAIAKARALLPRREMGPAAALLSALHPAWRGSVPAIAARAELARAVGDEDEARALERALDAVGGEPRPATSWHWQGSRTWTDVWAPAKVGALGIEVDQAPSGGAVVRVRVDGRTAVSAIARGGGEIRVPVELAAGGHLVEILPLAGGRVIPGRLTLVPGSSF